MEHPSLWEFSWGNLEGGSLSGGPEGDGGLCRWVSPFMGLIWATWGEHLYWGLCDMVERGSRDGAFTLRELCEGNLEWGLPYWGP
jgi:hypothetical protein